LIIVRPRIRSTFLYLLVTAMLLAGMPNAQSAAQETTAITIGTTDFPRTVDPADAIDYPSWELMTHLYTGLTRQIPGTLRYELALAADHRLSEDGLVHTLAVRPDAAFDDGTPITAETFVTSINRVIALERGSADFINSAIAAVTVSENEPNAVQFTLVMPLPDFEALIALPPFFPQHPGVYPSDGLLAAENAGALISNGVYRLESFQPGQEIVLAANEAYGGTPALNDRIVLRHYALPIDLRHAVQSHEVDVAWRALALPDLDAIAGNPAITIQRQPNLQVFYLLFNQEVSLNNQISFDDPAIRQAFALLIDRERAAELGFDGTVTPLYSLLPPQFGESAVSFPTRDVNRAEAILTEAGYSPRRRPIEVPLYISTENYGDLMMNAAQELHWAIEGSRITSISGIEDDQTATFTRAIYRGEYLDAIIGWRPPFASPAGYLIPLAYSTQRIPAAGGYASAEIDALLYQAALSTDPGEQQAAYQAVEALLLADYAILPLWQGQDVIAYWNDISGVLVEANSWLHYDRLTHS
jgi:peptide/nickel transport system substrate-binding protein